MIKILSIGNSFSQDAQRYLNAIAKKEGVEVKNVNLYIGGCTLRTHYINMLNDKKAYSFAFKGEETGLKVSISEALSSDDWDIVTLQQASHLSGFENSYYPYLTEINDYVKKFCPHAKIYIHQTWVYSDLEAIKKRGYESPEHMYDSLVKCYKKAVKTIKADGIIPSGEVMWKASQKGVEKVHRDGSHAALGIGRYMLALTWFKILCGGDVTNNSFDNFDAPVSDEERKIAIETVNEVTKQY